MTLFPTLLTLALSAGDAATTPAMVPDATPVHLGISLRITHAPELEAFRHAQQDPKSPEFRRWLTPQEFGDRFGQSSKVYAQAVAWLKAGGLEVTEFPNHIFVEGRGTAAQVSKLLGVHLLVAPNQPLAHFPDSKPTLPDALSAVILHIAGLDSRVRFHHHLAEAAGPAALGPQDLRAIYGVQPLLNQGFYGQGQQLVVLSEAEAPGPGTAVDPTVIQYFLQNTSDARAQVIFDTLPNPQQDFDPSGGGNTEFELDIEMQSVGSPGADSITLVIPPSSEVFSTGANEIASNFPLATAVSISLGTCEPAESEGRNNELQAMEQLVIQGTMEGQTWSSASGDNGSDDCQDGQTQAIDFPSDLPEMVAAGGTMFPNANFDANNAITAYQTEVVWNDGQGGAAGGGVSIVFPAPDYQSPFNLTGRSVPDIALIAGPPGAAADTTQVGQLLPVEGTSVASPLSAGFFGLIASRIGCRLGDPHATLYALGLAMFDGGAQIYHDITVGGVGIDGVTGYNAGVGFDSASGWGSLDVEALAAAWPSCGDAGSVGAGDAGAAYSACDFIDCQGSARCETVPEGPSSCVDICDTRSDGGCTIGTICSNQTLFTDGGYGSCVAGCFTDSDCLPDGGATVCDECTNECVPPGASASIVGDACNLDTDCPTGGSCITGMGFFEGGYCSLICDPFDNSICTCPSGSLCASFGNGGAGQCLETCRSPGFGCDRDGYACQPQLGAPPVCLPACTIQNFQGQSFDTCQFLYGGDAGCDVASGVCGGPVPFTDGGIVDAGVADAGTVADAGGSAPDAGDQTLPPATHSGCSCSPGAGGPDAMVVVVALGGLLRRKRRV